MSKNCLFLSRLAGAPGGGEMLVPYAPTLPKKNKDGHKKVKQELKGLLIKSILSYIHA